MRLGDRYGLEIRAAAAADAPGLRALLAEAGIAVGAADLAARLDALRRDGGTALVAVEWGPPSGLVALARVPSLTAARPAGLVTALLVAPGSRRRGIGRVLLKAAARAARQAGCDRLLLHAASGSDGGGAGRDAADLRAFCAASGFVAEGSILARPLLRRGDGG